MKSQFRFAAHDQSTALVIVFPPEVKGLFNQDVHELVRQVQEQLEGVYVTYALSSGNSPDLRAAMSAVRFVGCESAVVVPAEASETGHFEDWRKSGDWLLTADFIGPDLNAPAVVDAFMAAISEADRAA
jgi:hypothetical protein